MVLILSTLTDKILLSVHDETHFSLLNSISLVLYCLVKIPSQKQLVGERLYCRSLLQIIVHHSRKAKAVETYEATRYIPSPELRENE